MDDVTAPLPDRVRAGVAAATEHAELVRIDEAALERLAASIDPTPPEPFPEERWSGDVQDRAMGVVAWNAVNFGSGWFPHVVKIPGHSGARSMGARWQQHCRTHGVPSAGWLAEVTIEQVAEVFSQPLEGEVRGLLEAFTWAWQELGVHLLEHHDGSAAAMIGRAEGRGAALAAELAGLPCWDDRHDLGGLEVPLYKRAQIVVSNLAGAIPDHDLGRFEDLHTLTAFADNLVPHVLKVAGVLVVDPALDARIEREELLVSGERGEVELRAVGVHAVELLVDRLRSAGHEKVTAATIDHRLWQQGQNPAVKARPATAAGARTTDCCSYSQLKGLIALFSFSDARFRPLELGSSDSPPGRPVSWHCSLPAEVALYWPPWPARAAGAPAPMVSMPPTRATTSFFFMAGLQVSTGGRFVPLVTTAPPAVADEPDGQRR